MIAIRNAFDKYIIDGKAPFLFAILVWFFFGVDTMSDVFMGKSENIQAFPVIFTTWSQSWTFFLGLSVISAPLTFLFGGLMTHFFFWISGQNTNRRYWVSCRFFFLLMLPYTIVSLAMILTDMYAYGNTYFTEYLYNKDMLAVGYYAAGLYLPAFILNLYILLKGGSYLASTTKWRMFLAFFIFPILVALAIVGIVFLISGVSVLSNLFRAPLN